MSKQSFDPRAGHFLSPSRKTQTSVEWPISGAIKRKLADMCGYKAGELFFPRIVRRACLDALLFFRCLFAAQVWFDGSFFPDDLKGGCFCLDKIR